MQHQLGDMLISYPLDETTGSVGFEMIPLKTCAQVVSHRTTLRGLPEIEAMPDVVAMPADPINPLVHIKLVGDAYTAGFAQGRSMHSSPSNAHFCFFKQDKCVESQGTTITTTLVGDNGLRLEHVLTWMDRSPCVRIHTRVINAGVEAVTIEMLSSFALGGITPFAPADAPGRLRVHRFRSVWSAEARLDTQSIEQLHLERSWTGTGVFSERFGQVGSMPVRGWFPWLAAEDVAAGVLWGVELAWAGSWQMEVFRRDDSLCLAGGLADREFGHWLKDLPPGETLVAPEAILTCVQGDVAALCDRLVSDQQQRMAPQAAIERDLPIVCNEWCTTWGNPTHDRLVAIAQRLQPLNIKYLVIDAGWYKTDRGDWNNGHGDWVPNKRLFPKGLRAAADAIRSQGLIPGIWFEIETVGSSSQAFSLTEHLLQRDGVPLTVRSRRFWDFCDPWVAEHLAQRVIGLIKSCGFGYLKVDYNETIGIGADGCESQGEKLRKHIEGVYHFFDRIRAECPDLIIENCSSGGHRTEPSMVQRTAMTSFSDAHELVEIPIIAANLQQLIPPRQSQIWAVLHAADDDRRLIYSLAATFLGRMCISGEIDRLSNHQLQVLRQATELYRTATPIIANGISRRFGNLEPSWRHPVGWQVVCRRTTHEPHPLDQMLVIAHCFAGAPAEIAVSLDAEGWTTANTLTAAGDTVEVVGKDFLWRPRQDFSAYAAVLQKAPAGEGLLAAHRDHNPTPATAPRIAH